MPGLQHLGAVLLLSETGVSSNECRAGFLCWTTIYGVNGDSAEAIKYCTAAAAAAAAAAERNQPTGGDCTAVTSRHQQVSSAVYVSPLRTTLLFTVNSV